MGATLIILTLWMAFIWFVDPDGIASRGRRFERMHISKRRPSDAGLGSVSMEAGNNAVRRR